MLYKNPHVPDTFPTVSNTSKSNIQIYITAMKYPKINWKEKHIPWQTKEDVLQLSSANPYQLLQRV